MSSRFSLISSGVEGGRYEGFGGGGGGVIGASANGIDPDAGRYPFTGVSACGGNDGAGGGGGGGVKYVFSGLS